MCNFLLAVAIQFEEVIALLSHIQISVGKLKKGLLFYDKTPILLCGTPGIYV